MPKTHIAQKHKSKQNKIFPHGLSRIVAYLVIKF